MHRLLLISLLFFQLVTCAQAAGSAPESPEAFLRRLYKAHMADYIRDGYWFDDRSKLSPYFDAKLVELFLRDEACKVITREICAADADPIIDGQDFDGRLSYTLAIAAVGQGAPDKFKVVFANGGERRTIFYTLISREGGWRISDITYPDGRSLARELSGYRPVFEKPEDYIRYLAKSSGQGEYEKARLVKRDGKIWFLLFTLEAGNDYRQHLAALRQADHGYRLVDEIVVGGRGERAVESVRVTAGQVVLGTKEFGPRDPMCCPSVPGELTVTLQNDKLVKP